jgi:hypothetical protein
MPRSVGTRQLCSVLYLSSVPLLHMIITEGVALPHTVVDIPLAYLALYCTYRLHLEA